MAIDLSEYSLAGLLELQACLPKEIEKRRGQELIAARREVEEIARSLGMTLDELLAAPISGKVGTRPAMYRHPDQQALTWSGSGRQPGWVKTLLANGMTLDQLRISQG
jgi:DNA-binding protein H-NS